MAYYDTVILLVKAVVSGIALIGIVGFILPPLIKGLRLTFPMENCPNHRLEDFWNDFKVKSPKADSAESTHESIVKMARQDPVQTASHIRDWLSDKD